MLNLLYTYGFVMEEIKKILSAYDLTHQQYNILRILRGSHPEPLSTLQIRQQMLDKMSDTSRMVDRLIAKGLVQKTVSVNDKRLVDVTISVKGRKLLKKIDDGGEIVHFVMDNLSTKEMDSLSYLLDKIRDRRKVNR